MQRKDASLLPKSPARRKAVKTADQQSFISAPTLVKGAAAEPSPMNFRVAKAFHREFKLGAMQHGISMMEI